MTSKVWHIQNIDGQRAEFGAAGFKDFDAKLKAWKDSYSSEGNPPVGLPVYFKAPPVYTGNWDTQAWLRFVDWTLSANAQALERARESLRVENQDCDGQNTCAKCGASDYHSVTCERGTR